jgi:hypothetical protein
LSLDDRLRVGKAAGGFKYRVFPFGTLLGPEITGPKNFQAFFGGVGKGTGFVLFLIVPAQA